MASKSSWLLGGHKVSELQPAAFSSSRKVVMALEILTSATGKVENLHRDGS